MRLGLLLVLVAVGCAAPAGSGATTGVVRGTVTRGPVTPVCSNTQPCTAPAAGVTVVFLQDGRTVGHATTGADGTYRVRLAAGRYDIGVRGSRRSKPTRALVRRGQVMQLDITIDTGIR